MNLRSVKFTGLMIPGVLIQLVLASQSCGPNDSERKFIENEQLSGENCNFQSEITNSPAEKDGANHWPYCNGHNQIKQNLLNRKPLKIEDLSNLDLKSEKSESIETWIIGRKESNPQISLASKFGQEWHTSGFWSDEEMIADSENLAILDELEPSKLKSLDFSPHLIKTDLSQDQLSIELIKFKTGVDPLQILSDWQKEEKIVFFEPNQFHQPSAAVLSEFANEYNSVSSSTYWHNDIRLAETLNALATNALPRPPDAEIFAQAPIIAVIDSGFDIEHPALKNAIWTNPAVGVLCQNDEHGCNTSGDFNKNFLGDGEYWPVGTGGFNQSCPTQSNCLHGTHVAGIIAGYNEEKKIGVCPFCKILPIKVSKIKQGGESGISDSAIIRALQYISQFNRGDSNLIRIANASFGKYQRSRSVATLVRKLAGLSGGGVLIIGAASNEGSNERSYPAALPDAMSVSALDENKKKADFSNFGPSVDIAAPGTNIDSTVPGGQTKPDDGTSMAAPVVSGVAGLVLSLEPKLATNELRTRLIETANSYIYSSSVGEGFNDTWYHPRLSTGERVPLLGSGIVDAYAAVSNNRSQSIGVVIKNRVQPGCSQIPGHNTKSQNPLLYLCLLGVPFLIFLVPRQKSQLRPCRSRAQ